MKNLFTVFLVLLSFLGKAQNTFLAVIKNAETKQPVPRASALIKKIKLSAIANDEGVIFFKNIPNGKYDVEVSSVGYDEAEQSFSFPLPSPDTIEIFLRSQAARLDEVIVSSIRSGRSVKNTPTRVEVIAEDEVHEEATMRPGDIRMLLSESTGIQTQQTSATSANASI